MSNERKFLHDVANPIATALFVADGLVEDLIEAQNLDPSIDERMKQVMDALMKAQSLIQERREELIRVGVA